MTKKLTLTVSLGQAATISQALEIMSRLGIGQFRYLQEIVADGLILPHAGVGGDTIPANRDQIEAVGDHMASIARTMGFPENGGRSIGNAANPRPIREAWEIKKVIDRELAMDRDPNPSFRNVHYDGLVYRITDGPAPEAVITGAPRQEIVLLDSLPVIIDGPGDYLTRDGRRATIDSLDGPATFNAKGAIWKEFRGKMARHGYVIWHVSGRFVPLEEHASDIVGKYQGG